VSFLSKVKDAFNKLKSLGVKQKYKDFGIRVVEQLLQKIGLETKTTQQLCKRTVEFFEEGYRLGSNTLVAEIRTKFCSDEDFAKMEQAVAWFAQEAIELTPRDTGRLQASQYSFVIKEGDQIIGVIGYDVSSVFREQNGRTIYYAMVVHEIGPDVDHSQANYPNNPPRATWRFLGFAFEKTELRRRTRELFE
jgi:hypothetical protein